MIKQAKGWHVALLLSCLTVSTAFSAEPLRALPSLEALNLDEKKIKLGQRLFNDTRLSRDDTISCASCHNLATGGADNVQLSVGIDGQKGDLNTPSVFNTAYNFRLFWDGRAASLEEQATDPVHHPKEMGSNWEEVLSKLNKDKALVEEFEAVFDNEVSVQNIESALAEFQRSLLTPSRFDRYLTGDTTAITADELAGYKKFKSYGCVACHQGINIGGNMYQKFGIMGNYFKTKDAITEADLGRFNVTGRETDKHVFKVPSLRNIALTAPYLHDGSIETLPEAIDIMLKYQLGRTAPDEDKALIVTFLKALSREVTEP